MIPSDRCMWWWRWLHEARREADISAVEFTRRSLSRFGLIGPEWDGQVEAMLSAKREAHWNCECARREEPKP